MLTIEYTQEFTDQIRADDQKQAELKNFLRLTECWEIAEKMTYLEYRKVIRQYLS